MLGQAGARGVVAPGAVADLCVFPARSDDPAVDVPTLEPWDLELVLAAGQPAVGAPAHAALFEAAGRPFSRIRHADAPRCIVGDPCALLDRVAEALGYRKDLPFLPLTRD